MTTEALEFLRAAVETCRRMSLNRDRLDWSAIEADATRKITGEAAADAYDATRYLLRALGDGHSFLRTAAEWVALEHQQASSSTAEWPSGGQVRNDVWLLRLPPTSGGDDSEAAVRYIESAHSVLDEGFRVGVRKWIVDLRDNTGGSTGQMLGAAGPLFGREAVITYQGASGSSSWRFASGQLTADGKEVLSTRDVRCEFPLRVAVAVNRRTASAAEALAAGFVGRPGTALFGQRTYGATTGNTEVPMLDGSSLFIADSVVLDSKGRELPSGVNPDHETAPGVDAIVPATEWLTREGD